MTHYLKQRYQEEIAPALQKTLGIQNAMEVPHVEKIVVNIGVGEALDNAKTLDAAVADLTKITGQSNPYYGMERNVAPGDYLGTGRE